MDQYERRLKGNDAAQLHAEIIWFEMRLKECVSVDDSVISRSNTSQSVDKSETF